MTTSNAQADSARRSRNRRGQGTLLRGELIDAAAGLLADLGDARLLTLAAVARRAGVAAPSIYRHFANVNELVEAVVADCFARLDQALVDGMQSHPDPVPALRACCDAYCDFGLRNPGHYQILFNAHLGLDPDRPGDRPGERVLERLVTAVADCLDRGAGRRGTPRATAINVWVALHGIVSLQISRPHLQWPPIEDLIDATLEGQIGIGRRHAKP